jgi:hypothetical protein
VATEPEGSSAHSREPAIGPYPEPGESPPHPPPQPLSLMTILIPSSNLRLGVSSGLFSLGFPTKTLYTFLSSCVPRARPPHYSWFDRPDTFWWRYLINFASVLRDSSLYPSCLLNVMLRWVHSNTEVYRCLTLLHRCWRQYLPVNSLHTARTSSIFTSLSKPQTLL